jgi:CYTH domain-containing protein
VPPPSKYARPEFERRFLLAQFPPNATVTRTRRIADRYLPGTTLRLRELSEENAPTIYKFTQKIEGFITTTYLTEAEFRLLAQLPANTLTKTRYSVPPFGIDVFHGALDGLILAEAEFDSAAEADVLTRPAFLSHEVTDDPRFAGGRLVFASRDEIRTWLSEYGITFTSPAA